MFVCITILLSVTTFADAISGGHDSTIARHKWQLSLQHDNEHFCGAILIASTWALTSAGCVQLHPTALSVRGGSNKTTSGGQVVDVQTVIVHPKYNARTRDSDIALLQFSEEMNDTNIFNVKMPVDDEDVGDAKGTTLTGWGSTNENGSLADTLQMLQIPVTPSEQCQSAYAGSVISLNMFCVGWMKNGQRTACDADNGGPGMIEATLQGIISWGKGCGVEKYPTVLTRVSYFMPWIIETTGIDFPYYPPE